MSPKLLSFGLSLVLALGVANSFAEDAKKEKKEEKEEVVKTGILASQVNAMRAGAVDVSTDGAAPGDEGGVIGASVSVVAKSCVVRITNSGEKAYSVSYELIGKDLSGSQKLTRSFSSSIGPGKSVEQKTSGCSGDLNLFVNVKSAKPSS